MKKEKIIVAMSGGVDSSVAAALLTKKGYDVTGCFLQCWKETPQCHPDRDRADALRVAKTLGIPFLSFNFEKEYQKKVIDSFFQEYKIGRTPNPDVVCNKEIKFGLLLEKAKSLGFSKVATGHYAGVHHTSDGVFHLRKGVDKKKDQSYFLYRLTQTQLQHILFPVGHLTKSKVRRLAQKFQLPVAAKEESMGICFVGEVDIREFLKERIPSTPGEVVTLENKVIGSHEGLPFYTIGQRRGFRVATYVGYPLYVVAKDVKRNRLIVGRGEKSKTDFFPISDPHWIEENAKVQVNDGGVSCEVRIRHLGMLYKGTVKKQKGKRYTVTLKEKAFGVAPGQSAVFYMKERVLGGGIIEDYFDI
ncbi:MAG TPA: tRNA 2-thiouridine(34) synthase MnmA [Patescibacteria group bacterium]|nr:tRNA 2-thiouridine(34) synthase MnmA [Patescibacteria group bacterium]